MIRCVEDNVRIWNPESSVLVRERCFAILQTFYLGFIWIPWFLQDRSLIINPVGFV